MRMHTKKRIDIVIEQPVIRLVIEQLDAMKVQGYTVMPVTGGRGAEGTWSGDGMISEAGQMMLIFCVLDEARVDEVLEGLFSIVSNQIGIVTVSDVQVIRSEHF